MITSRENFYANVLPDFIPELSSNILICGGGYLDKKIFLAAGYTNVTISNIDPRMDAQAYSPFNWSFQDASNLHFPDCSFDYVVIHAAIHHSSTPHRVLTEMYRVSTKGILCFESRDSLLLRIFARLGLSQTYEHAAVYFNDCKFGGVDNTEIPNFVFRWTEREIEKTIRSYAPFAKPNIRYRYGGSLPAFVSFDKRSIRALLMKVFLPLYWLFTKIFPKQQNLFAFYIEKPKHGSGLFPWLMLDSRKEKIMFNKKWADKIYEAN